MSAVPPCSGACACGAKPADLANLPAAQARLGEQPLVRSLFRSRFRSLFHIPGMDCAAEEQMIRLRLADAPVAAYAFDLPGRALTLDHDGDAGAILERLLPLGYGAELVESRPLDAATPPLNGNLDPAGEQRVLIWLLAINATLFVIELGAGWWAHSAGLIADAMDMFADAAVYAVALYAVGRAARHKLTAARLSGGLQMLLAFAALAETARHMLTGAAPAGVAMVGIATLALAANIACLLLIYRHRHAGVHMRASYIFSANDVLANLGVIVAGLLVSWTASPWPDWIIGALIGLLVLTGALRILRLR